MSDYTQTEPAGGTQRPKPRGKVVQKANAKKGAAFDRVRKDAIAKGSPLPETPQQARKSKA